MKGGRMLKNLQKCALLGSILTGALLVVGSRPAAAQVNVDFESGPTSPVATYTDQGVTFSASGGGGQLFVSFDPNGTMGLLDNNNPRKEILASLAALGGASSVSVDLGDFDQDADTVFLEVFDAANASLGFTSQLLDA